MFNPVVRKTVSLLSLLVLLFVLAVALVGAPSTAHAVAVPDCKFYKSGGNIYVDVYTMHPYPAYQTYVQSFRWNSYPPPNGSHNMVSPVNVFRVTSATTYLVASVTTKDWFRLGDLTTSTTGCTYGYPIADDPGYGGNQS